MNVTQALAYAKLVLDAGTDLGKWKSLADDIPEIEDSHSGPEIVAGVLAVALTELVDALEAPFG